MVAQLQQNGLNYKALIWTVGTHALLLLLLFLLTFRMANPQPQPENGGFEVNLGTDENGSGIDQPMHKKKPAEYKATVVFSPRESQSQIPDHILQTTDQTAPEVDMKKQHPDAVKPQENPTNEPPKPEPERKPLYTYGGETGKGGNDAADEKNGSGEGVTKGKGDQGVPGGTPGAKDYTGIPGNGTGGIGHNLAGREIYPNRFDAEFRESGTVVIHVTVDRNGAIVNKRVTSSSSPSLTAIALEKLKSVHFSKSEGSEPQQFGDITFRFNSH